MVHQRRVAFLLVSRKSQEQPIALEHRLSRVRSAVVSRSTAEARIGQTSVTLTVLLAAGVLGSLAGGAAADRFGAQRSIVGVLGMTVPVGLVVASQSPSVMLLYIVAAAAGFLLTGAYTALTVAGQQSMPNNAGMVTGLNVGLASGLGGLAVAPLALMAEQIGLRAALALALITGPLVAVAICPLLASTTQPTATSDPEQDADQE